MSTALYDNTEKKDRAKTVRFGNRFEKWCPFYGPSNGALRANGALFSKKGTKTVPLDRQNRCPFAKGHQNSAPKGTVLWTVYFSQ